MARWKERRRTVQAYLKVLFIVLYEATSLHAFASDYVASYCIVSLCSCLLGRIVLLDSTRQRRVQSVRQRCIESEFDVEWRTARYCRRLLLRVHLLQREDATRWRCVPLCISFERGMGTHWATVWAGCEVPLLVLITLAVVAKWRCTYFDRRRHDSASLSVRFVVPERNGFTVSICWTASMPILVWKKDGNVGWILRALSETGSPGQPSIAVRVLGTYTG